MRNLILFLPMVGLMAASTSVLAQSSSSLLEGVKNNPGQARAMCRTFRQLNAEGQSALSEASIRTLATQRGLSQKDSEILATYVIGLHCTDVS